MEKTDIEHYIAYWCFYCMGVIMTFIMSLFLYCFFFFELYFMHRPCFAMLLLICSFALMIFISFNVLKTALYLQNGKSKQRS